MNVITPVIMCGGAGSRLWPLSRNSYPKQFLRLLGEHSMFQDTLLRLDGLEGLENPIVIVNEDHRFLVAQQLQEIDRKAQIILEPKGRNTAPAVALAALLDSNDKSHMLVLAADHQINNIKAFHEAINTASLEAQNGSIVTFGITPSNPATGYGYIKTATQKVENVFETDSFVEKPDAVTATEYLKDGNYYWNSGMFLMSSDSYLSELKKYRPDILSVCIDSMVSKEIDFDFIRPNTAKFENCPAESIDYAVMEKSDKVLLVPLDAGWSDVGAWSELWEISDKDSNGNAFSGDVITENCKNTLIKAQNRLVTAVGVENLIIVEDGDSILVADKSNSQAVKKIVDVLKSQNRPEAITHPKVYRPWGSYMSVDQGDGFKVKHISVKPGAKLSLQMHHHRAEHWIVVRGTGKVTRGEETILLHENESTYIPLGVTHRLENPGKFDLEIIEVQSGPYLEEDDIVRFEDDYHRI